MLPLISISVENLFFLSVNLHLKSEVDKLTLQFTDIERKYVQIYTRLDTNAPQNGGNYSCGL